uniref:Uncharacterized protein n=4 Tax=Aegilops tauschii subsp. strangulata TaxID=200361 RepID=A0A453CPS0_AEGTS
VRPHRDLWRRCLDLGAASLDTPLMCEVVVASLPSTPPPELVDDAGRLHLFLTVHHADEHRRTPHHGFLPANGERGVPSPLYWYNTFLRSVLVEIRCRCY